MANVTLSLSDTSGWIPEYWSLRALDVLRSNIVLATTVARDVNFAEAGWKGKTLNIGYPGTFVAEDKSPDSVISPQTPSGGTTIGLTLSFHKVVNFLVEDVASAQSNASVLDRYIQPAVIALAEQFETDLWAEVTNFTAASGGIGTPGTDIDAALVRSARQSLDEAKAPLSNRTMIVSPKDAVALMGDSDLAPYFSYSRPEGISQGSIGNLYGLDIRMSQLSPTSGSGPVTTTNAAYYRDAVLFAMRSFAPIPAGSGVISSTSNDPESGLSIRFTVGYSLPNLGTQCALDILYGTVALRPELGVIVSS